MYYIRLESFEYDNTKAPIMKHISVFIGIGLLTALLACQDQSGSSEEQNLTEEELMETGASITKSVGMTLIKTVQQKMSEGGVESALQFCNANALNITDSLSKEHGVRVKRTALKTRNPDNNPTELEKEALSKMALQQPPQASVQMTEDGNTVYFQPIVLKGFCQTCHGIPGQTMTVQTDSLIKAHYPSDRATGFSEGDLRGMWAVYFDE